MRYPSKNHESGTLTDVGKSGSTVLKPSGVCVSTFKSALTIGARPLIVHCFFCPTSERVKVIPCISGSEEPGTLEIPNAGMHDLRHAAFVELKTFVQMDKLAARTGNLEVVELKKVV